MCYRGLIFIFGTTASMTIEPLKKPFLEVIFPVLQRFPSSDPAWKAGAACSEAGGPQEHLLHGESVKVGTQLTAGSSCCCINPRALLGLLCPCSHGVFQGRVPRTPGCWGHTVLLSSPALTYQLTSQHRPFVAISKLGARGEGADPSFHP